MKLSHVGFKLRRAVQKRGVIGTLTVAPSKIMGRLSRGSKPAKQFNPVHPFDAEHGTDTSGLIAAEDLQDSRNRKNIHNTGFYATAPSMLHQAFARMDIPTVAEGSAVQRTSRGDVFRRSVVDLLFSHPVLRKPAEIPLMVAERARLMASESSPSRLRRSRSTCIRLIGST